MTRADALALRPGDRLLVAGRVWYTVVARPRQNARRPLMIVARPDGHDATARHLQVGAIRMERAW